jgi:alkanesulfonate monooxygenase SsuD/methylene tetrahydromethanopterin reductase-like flavin-dependent oxidoreductase (luciferase family)
MKLGIGLPNTLAPEVDRRLLLDWARLADEAGFYALGTIDKPNYDSWDPLVTLAAVAGVTEQIQLATTILQLPNRNEVLVAKQAAVIDRLSGGRLILGVAQAPGRTTTRSSGRASGIAPSGSRRRSLGFARSGQRLAPPTPASTPDRLPRDPAPRPGRPAGRGSPPGLPVMKALSRVGAAGAATGGPKPLSCRAARP